MVHKHVLCTYTVWYKLPKQEHQLVSTAVGHDGGPASIVRTNNIWQNTRQLSQSCVMGQACQTIIWRLKNYPVPSTQRRMMCLRHAGMLKWYNSAKTITLRHPQKELNSLLFYFRLTSNVNYIHLIVCTLRNTNWVIIWELFSVIPDFLDNMLLIPNYNSSHCNLNVIMQIINILIWGIKSSTFLWSYQ